uniref:Uncharacterized protein n=1 Tax=Arundo donax TaxID=35708 RepID=A0A0A9F2K1_ARUDO
MQPEGSVEVPITIEGDNCGLLQRFEMHYFWLCYFNYVCSEQVFTNAITRHRIVFISKVY